MKIVINYDLFDAILNSREEVNAFKIIRNNKEKLSFYLPIWYAVDLYINKNIPEALFLLLIQTVFYVGTDIITAKATRTDIYKDKSERKLKELIPQLQDLNISTDLELLSQSELYEKKRRIELNEKHLPQIVQEKYILVKEHSFNNSIKETSIKQEHILGTDDYVISLGSPKKAYKLAIAGAY